ncbi:MAG: hypothetical protein ACQESF_04120 [Nanobdellota archaeon]
MKIIHLGGVVLGILLITISRMFWINVCFTIAEAYDTLGKSTCESFQTFFFWAGITIAIISAIKFLFK